MPCQNGGQIFKVIALICWTAMLLPITGAYSQTIPHYFFKNITRDDGLNHDEVYDVTQDARGFMWILTRNGLQRYDGTRFINFSNATRRPSHFNDVNDNLQVYDHKKIIWINMKPAFGKVNATNFAFKNYGPKELFPDSSFKYQGYSDNAGNQWKLGEHFYFAYNTDDKQFNPVAYVPDATVRGHGNFFVTDNVSHQTWVGSNATGLMLFDSATQKIYTAASNPLRINVLTELQKKFGNEAYQVSKVMLDSNGDIWVATFGDEFYHFETATNQLLTYSLSDIIKTNHVAGNDAAPAAVTDFLRDKQGTLWVTTENAGLLRFLPSENAFDIVSSANTHDQWLTYKLYSIFQDTQENIWLGTNKGLMVFNPRREFFRTIRHEDNNATSLAKGEIADYIQTSSGDILVGTWGGGLTLFDSAWNFRQNISFKGDNNQNLIWCFTEAADGTIWIGAQHGYLHIFDPVTKKVITLRPPELENSTIRCITNDQAGDIWLGLHNGNVIRWKRSNGKFMVFHNGNATAHNNGSITNIFFDRQQRCWIGTESSFESLNATGDTPTQASIDTMRNHQFFNASVQGITQANDTTLLIATLFDGIKLFNTVSLTHSRLDLPNVPMQNVYAIRSDRHGNKWFTSDYSIYKFTSANDLRTFTIDRQTIHSTFDSKSFYQLQNGEWVTSTSTELFRFRPDSIDAANAYEVPVQITGLQVFDSTMVIDSLLQLNLPLHLSHGQNFLTIEWAKLEFFNLLQEQFYYRLIGIDKGWIHTKGMYSASYTNLPPGRYDFEVRVGDGNSPADVARLTIVIEPPVWRTWWFIILCACLFAAVIYLVVQWRIQILKAVQNEKSEAQKAKIDMLSMNEKLSMAKLDALRSQMNPHFIFNCLTSIDNLIQSGDTEKATNYLAKFARLMRSILETSSMTTVQCWKDLETLKMYIEMEELRWDKKFTYSMNIANDILTGDYKVPPLLIQPFVENAIHHGLLNKKDGHKDLMIEVWPTKNHIHYIIRDNGVGRTKAAAYRELNKLDHRSMGTQITIDRIRLLNHSDDSAVVITDLFDDKKQAVGTQVEVNILNQP